MAIYVTYVILVFTLMLNWPWPANAQSVAIPVVTGNRSREHVQPGQFVRDETKAVATLINHVRVYDLSGPPASITSPVLIATKAGDQYWVHDPTFREVADNKFKIAAAALLLATAFDLATTRYCIDHFYPDCRETNPILGNSAGRQIAIASTATAFRLWLMYRNKKDNDRFREATGHPRGVVWSRWVWVFPAAHTAAGISNLRDILRLSHSR